MAQYNLADTKAPKVLVPPYFSDSITMRVKKFSFANSKSSGKPQITLVTEIVKPDSVEQDGVSYVLAGQEITFYLGLSDDKHPKAKQSPLAATLEFHTKLGLPTEIDTDNLPYEGLLFEFLGSTKENIAQRRTKDGEYETVFDENGKPRTLGWEWNNILANVLGPSTLSTNERF
jgi:hypothetical protein